MSCRWTDICVECVGNDGWLLVDFLKHKVAVFAFAHDGTGLSGCANFALYFVAVSTANNDTGTAHADAITIFEKTYFAGERCEGIGIGGEKHFVLTVADG